MKITTKGRYGIRAIVDIAENQASGPVMLDAIAERHGLSKKYLHTLLTRLKSQGIVLAVRGAGGGYLLAKEPSDIRIDEVLHALEGKTCDLTCVDAPESCQRSEGCAARTLWAGLANVVRDYLSGLTLSSLMGSPIRENLSLESGNHERE